MTEKDDPDRGEGRAGKMAERAEFTLILYWTNRMGNTMDVRSRESGKSVGERAREGGGGRGGVRENLMR